MQERQSRAIRLRGVRVHNLKDVDVDIPRHQLVAVCGVSGSGKTSLALDTLYAEGQRRYIESFSAYTRQFLQRLDKPDCDSIEGLPPAIAVTRSGGHRGNRSTVATATETADYLRLLYAKTAQLVCYSCGLAVRSFDPQSTAVGIAELPPACRLMIAFPVPLPSRVEASEILQSLQQQGYLRLIVGDATFHLSDEDRGRLAESIGSQGSQALVVVDRVTAGDDPARITESLETAFEEGEGRATLLIEPFDEREAPPSGLPIAVDGKAQLRTIDRREWIECGLSRARRCERCDIEYPDPEPRLFSFNNPLGACPECEGFGDIMEIDMDLVVPDPSKSLREGAIAPWNTPSYKHELNELVALARRRKIPLDVPYSALDAESLRIIAEGSPADNFGGLRGFFAWLERKKYKMHVRVFLSRWRSYRQCPTCQGKRLRPEALAYRVGGRTIAEVSDLQVDHAADAFGKLQLPAREQQIAADLLTQIRSRLSYLQSVGLGYLQLNRTLRTLSGGESQRVALTGALGSNLVNMLYVLDEPTTGLHPYDVGRLSESILALRDRGNTVVAVEHDEAIMRASDSIIEVGPGAGTTGGRIVFQGTVAEMMECSESLTGDFLAGRRGTLSSSGHRREPRGRLQLSGASGNNLANIDVQFPLGVLCLVTGVSGSGKSSLVQQTLYGAICRRKRKPAVKTLPYRDVIGDGQIDDCVLIDQSPISRSPRSNPVTYIKAFDAIRSVFAETIEAKTRGMTSSYFSFNNELGRCEACQGDGVLSIDMQFLADVTMQCPECKGTRYRQEILQIRYRDLTIAEVLNLTVRQAASFFRGNAKLQAKLQRLIDVGLGYVGLGQSATTLSSGEAQRLKLGGFLASATRRRTLFILDEPTTGLHFADIVQLIDCFDALIADGHSLIVVEHNRQLMQAADYIIDLGPGAAAEGGRIVAEGTPEQVAQVAESRTGQCLRA
ncbi:excinuclease ABC subunit UvrA [Candidatus Laterigemmans baculatus]|uniref:excinuclease ABC subunit UvrA n=1 Tax=Candidatus Laterigemmans baculatus TaxID=2770505 RepID=UPI001F459E5C|nr:excinuclease ABC subunit UvrA [Candidatus Laterigemmans baculatus]